MDRQTWLAALALMLVLAAANFWCWQPGIGGGRRNPPGTELELYYGWPATYQAEWWRSEDPTLGQRLLQSMPFYTFAAEMELRNRYFALPAAVANLAFAVAAVSVLVIMTQARERLPRWKIVVAVLALVVMAAVLAASESLSQHL